MDMTNQCSTETAPTEDRRRATRYLIPAAISFRWETRDGHWDSAIGITRDIATSGLFVESESVPPVDAVIKLSVFLPARPKFDTTFQLKGTARIRHVQQEPCQTSGFGVVAVFHPDTPVFARYAAVGEKQCDA
jgi:PilZ domain